MKRMQKGISLLLAPAMVPGVHYVGSSLVLRTESAIRHYFTLPVGTALDDNTFLPGKGAEACFTLLNPLNTVIDSVIPRATERRRSTL